MLCLRYAFLFALLTATIHAETMRGFSTDSAQDQAALEAKILQTAEAENVGEYIRVMAAEPHHTGSEASRKVAQYILDKYHSWGLDAEHHIFDGLMPTPTERVLQMVAPVRYTAVLKETAYPEDQDSDDEGQLPTYNAYSPDGDVTGQIVYVNYGMPDDYQKLEELGVEIEGNIVLARYGGGWRGIKPKVAAEHGAIACLIYSDPKDDGYYQGDAYPKGSYRPEHGVQRGSTMDMPTYPGDPRTPGWGSEPGGKTLPVDEIKTLPKIPVLPISWGDAKPLLENLAGPVAPPAWRGALPLTYHLGPGASTVRLKLAFDWATPEGQNVIARIPGSKYPDEWIIYGNHHDAWVNGARDPVSGNAALMETARTLAMMAKQGWQPKRTIVFASWDAEEWGLIGSTEWGEKFADELRAKAVVYINTDSNGRGTLGIAGSHTLERLLNDAARAVPDPRTGKSIWAEMKEAALKDASDEDRPELETRPDLRISALGSGSDYTVFLDHLAIASANLGFREPGYGVYHSIYDSYDWYRRFGDPGYVYGRTLAQFNAVLLTRLADADVLPFEFTNLADTLDKYTRELAELRAAQLEATPEAAEINLEPLYDGIERIERAADAYERALPKAIARASTLDTSAVNKHLREVEQAMGREKGLPEREWYKHQIYAPGFYTGYGVKTLPGVREAMEQENWPRAKAQIAVLGDVFLAIANKIREAERALKELR